MSIVITTIRKARKILFLNKKNNHFAHTHTSKMFIDNRMYKSAIIHPKAS